MALLRVTLRTRLLSLRAVILLGCAALLGTGVRNAAMLVREQKTLYTQNFEPTTVVLQASSDINAARALYLGFQAQADPVKRSGLQRELADISNRLDAALTHLAGLEFLCDENLSTRRAYERRGPRFVKLGMTT